MSDEDKNVAPPAAIKTPESGVETKVPPAPVVLSPDDYEAALKTQDAKILRIEEEKSNYRRLALKAKGKTPEELQADESAEETMDDKIRRIAREESLNTQSAQAQAEREALVVKMAKENSELKLALRNRTNITIPSGGAAGPDETTLKDNVLSDAQTADLKKRFPHWTDKDLANFKANLPRV